MKLFLLFLLLVFVNSATYVFSTRPITNELERLEVRQRELDKVLAAEETTAVELSRLAELVETAQSAVGPILSAESSAQSLLRKAFLEAEKGLGLRRDTLEFRPEKQLQSGFGGVRIRVIEAGRFADVVTYLHRISHLSVPMALVEMSMVEAAKGPAPLLLTATFSALWPEEPDS
jgi:Tfp pilus assembly protein PilO